MLSLKKIVLGFIVLSFLTSNTCISATSPAQQRLNESQPYDTALCNMIDFAVTTQKQDLHNDQNQFHVHLITNNITKNVEFMLAHGREYTGDRINEPNNFNTVGIVQTGYVYNISPETNTMLQDNKCKLFQSKTKNDGMFPGFLICSYGLSFEKYSGENTIYIHGPLPLPPAYKISNNETSKKSRTLTCNENKLFLVINSD